MRKTQTFTGTVERDKGKIFILTEMPADQAERWAIRALLALARTGAELPAGAADAGMAGIAAAGLQALSKLAYEDAGPLLDEMMTCVRYQPPNPDVLPQPIYRGEACQIDEVATFLAIRKAVFILHTGFSTADGSPSMGSPSLPPA